MRKVLVTTLFLAVIPGLGWFFVSGVVVLYGTATLTIYGVCMVVLVLGIVLLIDQREVVARQRALFAQTGSRLKAYWLPILGIPVLLFGMPAFYLLGIAGASTLFARTACLEMTVQGISRTGRSRGTSLVEAAPLFDTAPFTPNDRSIDKLVEGTRVELTGPMSALAIDVRELRYTDRRGPEGVRDCSTG